MLRQGSVEYGFQTGVTLESAVTPVDLVMNVDKPRMEQAVLNLLNNSIKFSCRGGSVKVSITYPYTGAAGIPGSAYALMAVTDTGEGVASEDIMKIFGRFFQAEEHTTRKYQGMGLGLFITKKIIEGHGGIIWAESKGRGLGTTINALLLAS